MHHFWLCSELSTNACAQKFAPTFARRLLSECNPDDEFSSACFQVRCRRCIVSSTRSSVRRLTILSTENCSCVCCRRPACLVMSSHRHAPRYLVVASGKLRTADVGIAQRVKCDFKMRTEMRTSRWNTHWYVDDIAGSSLEVHVTRVKNHRHRIWVTGQFRCATVDCAILTPNSQICVALMVSAPIYVAQKQMSYLRDPENKIGAFGWGTSLKRRNTRNTTRKMPKMIVAPPGEWNVNRISPFLR